ncbi:membrane protein [Nocardia brevicatena]|uniref:membrane protein n=1 Tax=Nocardia brevicatena TaxID=37327 RepID=UPI00030058DA|nr:membrane protein [Nocardia brevicatena]
MANDAEKRWTDRGTYRRAARYVVAVSVVAAVVFGIAVSYASSRCGDAKSQLCDGPSQAAVLIGPSSIALLGGIGAFVQTFREWRRGGNWPIWQGAGWFLFVLMLLYLGIGGTSAGTT